MTRLQHIAWYNPVIANVYAVGGKEVPFIAFLIIAVLCFGAAYFETRV